MSLFRHYNSDRKAECIQVWWHPCILLFFFNLSLTFLFSRISLLLFLSLFARCESIQPFSLIHLGCIGPMSEEKGEQLEQIKAQKISRSSGRILDARPVPRPKDRHRPHKGTAARLEWQVLLNVVVVFNVSFSCMSLMSLGIINKPGEWDQVQRHPGPLPL